MADPRAQVYGRQAGSGQAVILQPRDHIEQIRYRGKAQLAGLAEKKKQDDKKKEDLMNLMNPDLEHSNWAIGASQVSVPKLKGFQREVLDLYQKHDGDIPVEERVKINNKAEALKAEVKMINNFGKQFEAVSNTVRTSKDFNTDENRAILDRYANPTEEDLKPYGGDYTAYWTDKIGDLNNIQPKDPFNYTKFQEKMVALNVKRAAGGDYEEIDGGYMKTKSAGRSQAEVRKDMDEWWVTQTGWKQWATNMYNEQDEQTKNFYKGKNPNNPALEFVKDNTWDDFTLREDKTFTQKREQYGYGGKEGKDYLSVDKVSLSGSIDTGVQYTFELKNGWESQKDNVFNLNTSSSNVSLSESLDRASRYYKGNLDIDVKNVGWSDVAYNDIIIKDNRVISEEEYNKLSGEEKSKALRYEKGARLSPEHASIVSDDDKYERVFYYGLADVGSSDVDQFVGKLVFEDGEKAGSKVNVNDEEFTVLSIDGSQGVVRHSGGGDYKIQKKGGEWILVARDKRTGTKEGVYGNYSDIKNKFEQVYPEYKDKFGSGVRNVPKKKKSANTVKEANTKTGNVLKINRSGKVR